MLAPRTRLDGSVIHPIQSRIWNHCPHHDCLSVCIKFSKQLPRSCNSRFCIRRCTNCLRISAWATQKVGKQDASPRFSQYMFFYIKFCCRHTARPADDATGAKCMAAPMKWTFFDPTQVFQPASDSAKPCASGGAARPLASTFPYLSSQIQICLHASNKLSIQAVSGQNVKQVSGCLRMFTTCCSFDNAS